MGNRLMTRIARPILKLRKTNRGLHRTEARRVSQLLRLWTVSIAIVVQLILTRTVYSQAVRFKKQAVWVFPDAATIDLTDSAQRTQLVQRSADSGVDVLYVSVFQSPPPIPGDPLMYPAAAIADLIARAHDENIQVWAAYGNPDWGEIGCDAGAFPRARMAEVIAYNAANLSAQFDGVILDVEVEASVDSLTNLVTLYECILTNDMQPNGLGLAAAIRFFWDTPILFAGEPETRPAYEHIIDLGLENVVVMGYRDEAGVGSSDGIIALDEDEIDYADSKGKSNLIMVGLETQDCVPGCGEEKVTFFLEQQATLNAEAAIVVGEFADNLSFGGFAIHRYGDAYLGNIPGWPQTNAPPEWEEGDVFVASFDGSYHIYDSAGCFKGEIPDPLGTGATRGAAFDANFDLYTTYHTLSFSGQAEKEHKVIKYDGNPPHDILQTIDTQDAAAALEPLLILDSFRPNDIVFAVNGDFYVSHDLGPNAVHRYNSLGELQESYDVETHGVGPQGIDLASDQRTLFHTTLQPFGTSAHPITRYDVEAVTQLTNFTVLADPSAVVRLLPPYDGSAGLIATLISHIARVKSAGEVDTYDAAGEDFWFALDLDPDGTGFWAAGLRSAPPVGSPETGKIYHFTLGESSPDIVIHGGPSQISAITVRGSHNTAASTAPVTVELPSGTIPTTVIFPSIEEAGTTTLIPNAVIPSTPQGFELANQVTSATFELVTTATFTVNPPEDLVQVCVNYTALGIPTPEEEENLRLFHYEGMVPVDITDFDSPDIENDEICGSVADFSPFAIFIALAPQEQIEELIDRLQEIVDGNPGACADKVEDALQDAQTALDELDKVTPRSSVASHTTLCSPAAVVPEYSTLIRCPRRL